MLKPRRASLRTLKEASGAGKSVLLARSRRRLQSSWSLRAPAPCRSRRKNGLMPSAPRPGEPRHKAHVRAFRLIEGVQSGDPSAGAALGELAEEAERQGWSEVTRAVLFGQTVEAWMSRDATWRTALQTLIERSSLDGDHLMLAVGLAMRSGLSVADDPAGAAAAEHDLARAAAMVERAEGGSLQRITAHTACGIAFGNRWLWELGDEQYAAALAIGETEATGTLDFVLAPVVYNRAEVQVSWASMLRQIDDTDGLAERLRTWEAASEAFTTFGMPEIWRTELEALGLLLKAIAGEDTAEQVCSVLAGLREEGPAQPRTVGHLRLARALSDAGAGRPGAEAASEAAIDAIDPSAHPHEYDLALYVAAELEAAAGHGAGLRCAQRQLGEHWASRLATLGAMRARIEGERISEEYDTLTRHAHLDDLTGLANRRALDRYVAELSYRNVERIAVMAIDVDSFKTVNDRFGHGAGDETLVAVSRALESNIRSADLAVRLGGDEFVIILADADLEVSRRRAETVLAELDAEDWEQIGAGLHVAVSIGIAAGELSHLDRLRENADNALYKAKALGGHRIVSGTEVRGGP